METVEARRRIKESMEETQLAMKHTENCTVLPDRGAMLDRMKKGSIVAEIGVAFGEFSKEILERCQPKKLHLVDAWESERYVKGLEGIRAEFSPQIDDGLIEIHQGRSTDILRTFEYGQFDWVYIDTNHTYETTLLELQISSRKVVEGGRISGHDFCTGNVIAPVPYGVVEAVTKFCSDFDWEFEFLTIESRGHFSFCLKKIQ